MSAEERLEAIRKKIAEKEEKRKELEQQEELTEQELLEAQAELTQELEELRQETERAELQKKVHALQRAGKTAAQIQEQLQEEGLDASGLIAAQRILERSKQARPRREEQESSIDQLLGIVQEEEDAERGILYALRDQVLGQDLYQNASADLYSRLQSVQQSVERFGMTGAEYDALNAIQAEIQRQHEQDYRIGVDPTTDAQSLYAQRELSLINQIKQRAFAAQRSVYDSSAADDFLQE